MLHLDSHHDVAAFLAEAVKFSDHWFRDINPDSNIGPTIEATVSGGSSQETMLDITDHYTGKTFTVLVREPEKESDDDEYY